MTPQSDARAERGALTGSGGVRSVLELVTQLSENPTVATAVGGAVAGVVGGKVLGSSAKDPPPPPPPADPPAA
jgi:hypothetical protein